MNVVEKAICTPDASSGSDVMEAVNGLEPGLEPSDYPT
jgi:hypothetical protein